MEPNEVLAVLDFALAWLESSKDLYTNGIFGALRYRLLHRRTLLYDLSRETEEWVAGATPEWDSSLELLTKVEETHKLGKPVPEAFSTSVQRKLASQVPPRPLVVLSFEDATSSLRKLCVEGKDVLRILQYNGSTNLVVSKNSRLALVCWLMHVQELLFGLYGSSAVTFTIHTLTSAVFVLQRDEDFGSYACEASLI